MEGNNPAAKRATQRKAFLSRLLPQNLRVFLWDFGHSVGPVIVVGAIVLFAALHFVRPAPPKTLTIAAGVPGSRFNLAAQQYQKILKRNGITLEVVSTEGSLDNLNRLSTGRVDIALVQAGVAPPGDTGDLISLGSVFYVPLTVFYRSPTPIQRLSQLRGQRIAIGSPGSGTRAVALALLGANEIDEQGPTQISHRRMPTYGAFTT